MVSKRTLIVEFDFNQTYENVEFSANVNTTDYYRRGYPYKLFTTRGSSQVKMKFVLPDGIRKPTVLYLTVTEGCWSGMIDVFLNGLRKVEKLPAVGGNFQRHEIRLELDENDNLENENIIIMKLRDDAHMVYWLSDAKIEVTHIVPSSLQEITACTVSDMIKNGQMDKSVIIHLKKLVKFIEQWKTV